MKQTKRRGEIEMATLVKWGLLLVFLVLVIIIIMAARGTGDETISSLCERSGGLFGC
jgi:hypothetical protein